MLTYDFHKHGQSGIAKIRFASLVNGNVKRFVEPPSALKQDGGVVLS
ncbi:hypothetical protein [Serratia marcescens]